MNVAERLEAAAAPIVGPLPVRVRAWDGSEAGPADAPVVEIHSRRALRQLAWAPGELGLARAYVTGEIDVPGGAEALSRGLRQIWRIARERGAGSVTPSVMQRFAAFGAAVRLGAVGLRPPLPAAEARLAGGAHTKERDAAAVSHHYDLSNEFYSLILDPEMVYSCAYYENGAETLAEAQRAKLDLICRKLGLREGQRLLDVGCGWGSLAIHAAEHFGVSVLGVTISAEQQAFVEHRLAERGLTGRVEVRVQDYRDLDEEPFDAVGSIEMGEHVGEENYPVYLDTIFRLLRPTGRLALQQMSRRRGAAPGGGAFIEGYIAPDMHMRPLPRTLALIEAAGFEISAIQSLREHYVRTVTDWLAAFEANRERATELVGEELVRIWLLYLVGGGLSFEESRMGVHQIVAVRPDATGSR